MAVSTNAFFHFTSLDAVQNILINKFRPRASFEVLPPNYMNHIKQVYPHLDVGYLIPMVSFCDIPLSRVKDHVDYYCKNETGVISAYGIGMKKDWGIRQGLNPLFYLNHNSTILEHFIGVYNSLYANRNSFFAKQSGIGYVYGDSVFFDKIPEEDVKLIRVLALTKPYKGLQYRKLGGENFTERVYYDEKEWRFLPKNAGLFAHWLIKIDQGVELNGRKITSAVSMADLEKKKNEINSNFYSEYLNI